MASLFHLSFKSYRLNILRIYRMQIPTMRSKKKNAFLLIKDYFFLSGKSSALKVVFGLAGLTCSLSTEREQVLNSFKNRLWTEGLVWGRLRGKVPLQCRNKSLNFPGAYIGGGGWIYLLHFHSDVLIAYADAYSWKLWQVTNFRKSISGHIRGRGVSMPPPLPRNCW